MASIEPPPKIFKGASAEGACAATNLLDLPSEMLLAIFRHLDHKSLANCARVCRRCSELSRNSELFRDVTFTRHCSICHFKWLLGRTTNPRRVTVCREALPLISLQISSWRNVEELDLVSVNLEDVSEGRLEHLNSLTVRNSTVNCVNLGKLLGHSNAIRKVVFVYNFCSNCVSRNCSRILSKIPLEACTNAIEELTIVGRLGVAADDLKLLSACANLKTLKLSGHYTEIHMDEAAGAIEAMAKACTKLESANFVYMTYVSDNVLEVMSNHCANLKELVLCNLPCITEKGCLSAINHLPQLHTLKINNCAWISGRSERKLKGAIAKLGLSSPARAPPQLFVHSIN